MDNMAISTYNGYSVEDLQGFEDDIAETFKKGLIRYPIHLSGGNFPQLMSVFKENQIGMNDWLFCSHRNHPQALLKGIPKEWLKEQIIRGNSMHIMSKEYKFFSSSIVGGSLPIAVGMAWALKNTNQRVFAFCGDMASFSGIFSECEQYSDNFNLPITFIIENNNMSTNSPTDKTWGVKYAPFSDIQVCHQWENGKTLIYTYERTCEHINIGSHVEFK